MNNAFAIAEVVDFVVQDYRTKDVLFLVDYAQNVSLGTNAERLNISGGIGNYTLLSIDHTKTANFESMLPLVDVDALGVKLGKKAIKGTVKVPMNERLAVASNKVTLTQTPITGTLKVYVLENGRDIKTQLVAGATASATEYTITGKEITLHNSIATDTLILCVYDYMSGANAKQVTVTATDFPTFIRITGRGIGEDQAGNKAPVVFDVKKMKVIPEFQMAFASGTATEIAFNGDMFAHDEVLDGKMVKKYFDVTVLPDEIVEIKE